MKKKYESIKLLSPGLPHALSLTNHSATATEVEVPPFEIYSLLILEGRGEAHL